jgi:Na+/proline symporter
VTGIDWGVFGLYLVGVMVFALWQSRKNEGVEGFFLGNRTMPWWAIGLSVMATQASAITLIGTTGQGYTDGMRFVQTYLPLPFAMIILSVVFVPFFYRAKLFTAYEYLEKRFDPKTRTLTSMLFLIGRAMGTGVIMYAPAIVLSTILGWDEVVTISIMAVVTIGYTVTGGITAVIWTDVVQMLMMFLGIGLAIVFMISGLPDGVGVADAAYIGGVQQMWNAIDFSWDPQSRYTIWSGLIGGTFLFLSYFGADQSQVQRYLTANSERDSRLSLMFNGFLKVPMQIAILGIGVLMFAFYHFEQPPIVFNDAEVRVVMESERADEFEALSVTFAEAHAERRATVMQILDARDAGPVPPALEQTLAAQDEALFGLRDEAKAIVLDVRGAESNDTNYIFPTYLTEYFPIGLVGLMIATIFAAAMSSIDSELTALSSATVIDFYRRWFVKGASDAHYLNASRLATLFWGLVAWGFALRAGQGGSLIELVNQVGSLVYGSILGGFLLAFLVKRAHGTPAFIGILCGFGTIVYIARETEIGWLWWNVIGVVVVMTIGTALSYLMTPPSGGQAARA